jgi:hypothetical protein
VTNKIRLVGGQQLCAWSPAPAKREKSKVSVLLAFFVVVSLRQI